MVKKTLFTTFLCSYFLLAHGQDSTAKLTIHGSADVYYRHDFSDAPNNGLTSFTQSHDRFELGMAYVDLNYQTSKTQVVVDLGFGKRARDFSYTDKGILTAVQQAYISYTPVKNLVLTAGSWDTHIGYELPYPGANSNYSMSYMFTTGPFSHTGVKAAYTLGKSSLMLGIANPTDYKYVPDTALNKKFMLAQYHFAGGRFFDFYLNYVGGQGIDTSKTKQIDMVAVSNLSDHFKVGVNATLGLKKWWQSDNFSSTKKWWGAALYLTQELNKYSGISLREEYFDDQDAASSLGLGATVWSSTLSFNIKAENLTIIPEFRIDAASKPISYNTDKLSKTDVNMLVALVYSF